MAITESAILIFQSVIGGFAEAIIRFVEAVSTGEYFFRLGILGEPRVSLQMSYNPKTHHRRSIRLRGYDYSPSGFYFVTICAYQRQRLFGDVVDGKMQRNDFGKVVASEWVKSVDIRREVECDEWIVMPNHVHGIVRITAGANGHVAENNVDMDASPNGVGGNGRTTKNVADTVRSHNNVGKWPFAPTGVSAPRNRPPRLPADETPIVIVIHHRVQVRRHQTNQHFAQRPRRTGLATQLLRAHHS